MAIGPISLKKVETYDTTFPPIPPGGWGGVWRRYRYKKNYNDIRVLTIFRVFFTINYRDIRILTIFRGIPMGFLRI